MKKILAASIGLNVALIAVIVLWPKAPALPAAATSGPKPGAVANPGAFQPSSRISSSEPPSVRPQAAPLAQAIQAPSAPVPEIRFPAPSAAAASANTSSFPSQTVSASPDSVAGVAVDSSRPGNSIRFHGMRVAVATNFGTSLGGQPSLAVDLTPDSAATGSGTTGPTEPADAQPGSEGMASLGASASEEEPEDSRVAKSDSEAEENPGAEPGSADSAESQPRKSRLRVFTREEELFRTQWGWAAFDMAQREANREATNPAVGTQR